MAKKVTSRRLNNQGTEMQKMAPLDVIQCGWLGLVTVGECYNHVMNHYDCYFLIETFTEDLIELDARMNEELGKDWPTHTCYEAADLLGFDLTAYYKHLDEGLELTNKKKEWEREATQYLGVL
jgi:hypothetical protein